MTEKEFNELIKPESLEFLSKHFNDNPDKIALKFQGTNSIPIRAISEQIICRKKAEIKLPILSRKNILFEKVALEQSSGEIAAQYKAGLLEGNKIIDLTGGLGIDDIFICRNFQELIYCERDPVRFRLFSYNKNLLGIKNILTIPGDSIETLLTFGDDSFDWILIDPSRRDENRRYIGLQNCSPDVLEFQELFLKKAPNIMIKASPALELQEVKKRLKCLKEFIVVSVDNECKEILLLLTRNNKNNLLIKAVSISSKTKSIHTISSDYSETCPTRLSETLKDYFFEPDVSIIKARLTKSLIKEYPLQFINKSTDYLTGDNQVAGFPGRQFKIETVLQYKKQMIRDYLKEQSINKANIARRDFPDAPEVIRKNFGIKDGGDSYIFFTKDYNNKLIVVFCHKV